MYVCLSPQGPPHALMHPAALFLPHLRYAVRNEGGQVLLADGLARSKLPVAKEDIGLPLLNELDLQEREVIGGVCGGGGEGGGRTTQRAVQASKSFKNYLKKKQLHFLWN